MGGGLAGVALSAIAAQLKNDAAKTAKANFEGDIQLLLLILSLTLNLPLSVVRLLERN
jgi:hypothetical protein